MNTIRKQSCDGPKGRCEGSWEGVTVVSIFWIHLGGVTLTGEVCKPARWCSVKKVVLTYPGAMRSIKHVWVPFRKCDSCQGVVTVVNIDCKK